MTYNKEKGEKQHILLKYCRQLDSNRSDRVTRKSSHHAYRHDSYNKLTDFRQDELRYYDHIQKMFVSVSGTTYLTPPFEGWAIGFKPVLH